MYYFCNTFSLHTFVFVWNFMWSEELHFYVNMESAYLWPSTFVQIKYKHTAALVRTACMCLKWIFYSATDSRLTNTFLFKNAFLHFCFFLLIFSTQVKYISCLKNICNKTVDAKCIKTCRPSAYNSCMRQWNLVNSVSWAKKRVISIECFHFPILKE